MASIAMASEPHVVAVIDELDGHDPDPRARRRRRLVPFSEARDRAGDVRAVAVLAVVMDRVSSLQKSQPWTSST